MSNLTVQQQMVLDGRYRAYCHKCAQCCGPSCGQIIKHLIAENAKLTADFAGDGLEQVRAKCEQYWNENVRLCPEEMHAILAFIHTRVVGAEEELKRVRETPIGRGLLPPDGISLGELCDLRDQITELKAAAKRPEPIRRSVQVQVAMRVETPCCHEVVTLARDFPGTEVAYPIEWAGIACPGCQRTFSFELKAGTT